MVASDATVRRDPTAASPVGALIDRGENAATWALRVDELEVPLHDASEYASKAMNAFSSASVSTSVVGIDAKHEPTMVDDPPEAAVHANHWYDVPPVAGVADN